jgi:ribosomal protein L27
MKFLSLTVLTLSLGQGAIYAQTAAPAAAKVLSGTVTAVDSQGKKLTVKSDKGDIVTVTTTDRSFLFRVPAGETSTKNAVKINFSDMTSGDRLLASGQMSADQKSLDARTIYIMIKSDVAEIQKKEQEDWQKRGTTGTVTAVDSAAKTLTMKVGQREVTVQAGDKTDYHRYSLDSAKFTDAKPSTFAEIKVGDQARVLGDKSADGTSVKAEKIVAGTFRQLAGTIESIDAGSGELKVKDLATKKSLTIRVDPESTMKKLTPMMAVMLARRLAPGGPQGGGQGPGGRGGDGGGRAGMGAPGGQGGPGGAPGMGRGGRGGDIGQMLDGLPPMPLSELKAGDVIMVSTTMGTDPTKVTAITLLAGVEDVLRAAPTATRDIMSGWNLGGGGGGGEGN